MIKKILPISIFILVVVVIILLGLQSMLSKKKLSTEPITPTMIPGNQGRYFPNKSGINQGSETRISSSIQPLTSSEFQQKLPIIASDFVIDYSSRMQKYIVTLKTDTAQEAYTQWLTQNMSLAPYLTSEQVIITRQTVTELNAALDYAKKNELTPEKKAIQEAQDLTKNLGLLINLPFLMQSTQSNTTTPSPLVIQPTAIPTPSPQAIPTLLVLQPSLTPASYSSVSNNLLPNPIPPIASQALNFKSTIGNCLSNKATYETASSQSGIPWEILAAIHYNEGACGDTKSLVSGREIGTNEPDIVRGGGCSSGVSGAGIPVPLPSGGCGFYTLLDSAIYAGNHIKGKIGKVPSNFEELAQAFSRYSGGGNSNCGKTPYTSCPRLFEGEDDAYVMNMFDQKHETMYLVYCADLTKCNPPRVHGRPGVATLIRLITNNL